MLSASGEPASQALTLEEMERRHIRGALERSRWVIEGPGGAARALGLHPNTLRSRMARLDITRPPHEIS
jgi:transcriptional regulator with GAF, ATPase, and Fis domain